MLLAKHQEEKIQIQIAAAEKHALVIAQLEHDAQQEQRKLESALEALRAEMANQAAENVQLLEAQEVASRGAQQDMYEELQQMRANLADSQTSADEIRLEAQITAAEKHALVVAQLEHDTSVGQAKSEQALEAAYSEIEQLREQLAESHAKLEDLEQQLQLTEAICEREKAKAAVSCVAPVDDTSAGDTATDGVTKKKYRCVIS